MRDVASGGTTVLLVEDDAVVASIAREVLEEGGHTVVHAWNCREALQLVARNRPRVAVVDRYLPDGDGLALCGELKAAGVGRVVVCSAALALEAALGAGADGFLIKPYRVDELVAEVGPRGGSGSGRGCGKPT